MGWASENVSCVVTELRGPKEKRRTDIWALEQAQSALPGECSWNGLWTCTEGGRQSNTNNDYDDNDEDDFDNRTLSSIRHHENCYRWSILQSCNYQAAFMLGVQAVLRHRACSPLWWMGGGELFQLLYMETEAEAGQGTWRNGFLGSDLINDLNDQREGER